MPTPCNKDSMLNEAENRDIRKHSNSSDITNNSKGTPSDNDPCLDRARGWCGQGSEKWQPQGQAVLEGIVLLLLQLQKNAFHLPQVCETSSAKPGYLLTLGRRETIPWAQLQAMRMCFVHLQLREYLTKAPQLLHSEIHCYICVKIMFPLSCTQQAMSTAATLRPSYPQETWDYSDGWLRL